MNHSNSQSLQSSSMYSTIEQRSKQQLKTLDTEGPISSSPGLEEPYQLAAAAHLNEDIAFFSNDAKQQILNYHCKSNLDMRHHNDDKSRVKLKYSSLSLNKAILSPKLNKIKLDKIHQQ